MNDERSSPTMVTTPPRILTVNRVGFIGGVERLILSMGTIAREQGFNFTLACPAGDLALEAARRGFDVAVSSIDRSKSSLSPVQFVRLGSAMVQGQWQLAKLARQTGTSLIHVHHPIGALYAAQAARQLRLPMILHVHETLPVSLFYLLALRRAIPACSHFVGVSDASVELLRSSRVPQFAVRRVYNGVAAEFLQPTKPSPELGGSGPHIGLFGVLEPRKGQDLFLQAAANIARDYVDAQFWIVGKLSFPEHQGYLDGLHRLASEPPLAGRVHFTGHRDDVRQIMAGMDVVVLASRAKESLPTVMIEAAMLGRMLVATDVGGVREIVEDGVTGLVIQPGSPAALAIALRRALDPASRPLADLARTEALHRFGPQRFANDICSLYIDVLQGSHGWPA